MNLKISGLTELSAQPADDDVLAVVDVNDTTDAATGTTKKIQASNLIKTSSATEKGVVELATQAEYDAGTATGDTGAPLLSSPATTRGKKYNDYAADVGVTDAYAITVVPAITAYATGQVFTFKANTANTGSCTLAVCGLSAINIVKGVSTALVTGDILAGQIVTVVYNGTNMQVISRLAGGDPTVTVYTSGDTWTKPDWATTVKVVCIGAGGSGGGAQGAAAGNVRKPGAGGGGGSIAEKTFRASVLDSNVAVTIGVGAAGGAGGATAEGSAGTNGGTTSFGSYLSAGGGVAGGGSATRQAGNGGHNGVGTAAAGTSGISGQGGGATAAADDPADTAGMGEYGGGAGGAVDGNATANARAAAGSLFGGGGGGGGGSISAANETRDASAGGAYGAYSRGTGGAAGTSGAASTAGTAGTSRSGYGCGNGGGGGGSDTDSTGSAGGAGGAPGGGGGGGGGGTNVGGKGGTGGQGEVRVFCW